MGGLFTWLWRKLRGDDSAEEDWIIIGTDYNQLLLWRQEAEVDKAKEKRHTTRLQKKWRSSRQQKKEQRIARQEEEQRIACQRAEQRIARQQEEQRIARQQEEQRMARQQEEQRMARQQEEQRMARQQEEQRMARQQEEQRMARQQEEQRIIRQREEQRIARQQEEQRTAHQEEEARRNQRHPLEAEERVETEATTQQPPTARRGSFDEWILIDREIHDLRLLLLIGEKELRHAEQKAAMATTRLRELDRCSDPADRTYWTHAQVGRDGQVYFWDSDGPCWWLCA